MRSHAANAARIKSLVCEKRPVIAIDAVTPTTVASNRNPALSSAWPRVGSARTATVSAAVVGDSSCSQKLTNKARMVASQTRMAKLQELTGIFAKAYLCSDVIATTVVPLRMLRHSRSVVTARYIDRGDETVAAPRDVDDEPMSVPAITQRATQRGYMDGEVRRLDKDIRPDPIHQVLLTD